MSHTTRPISDELQIGFATLYCAGCCLIDADATEIRPCARCKRQVAACSECVGGAVRLVCNGCRNRPAGW